MAWTRQTQCGPEIVKAEEQFLKDLGLAYNVYVSRNSQGVLTHEDDEVGVKYASQYKKKGLKVTLKEYGNGVM